MVHCVYDDHGVFEVNNAAFSHVLEVKPVHRSNHVQYLNVKALRAKEVEMTSIEGLDRYFNR